MYLNEREVEKIAAFIVRQIKKADISVTDEPKALAVIAGIINDSLEEERKLEEDAMKLIKQYGQGMGSSLDHDKAIRMIKEKLAKERGFVL